MHDRTIITIGRQFGSGGREIGKKLADQLGVPFYDKELLELAAEQSGISRDVIENYDEMPTNSPSREASSRAVAMASSSATGTTRSTTEGS